MKDIIIHIVSFHRDFICDACGWKMFVEKGTPMTKTWVQCLMHMRMECERCHMKEVVALKHQQKQLLSFIMDAVNGDKQLKLELLQRLEGFQPTDAETKAEKFIRRGMR